MTRPDWDSYFADIASVVAARATCTRRRVGAVVVKRNRIVGSGYNGAPSGQPHCLDGACPRGLLSYDQVAPLSDYRRGPGRCIAAHAEINAIRHTHWWRRWGATLYITCAPCEWCRASIRKARVKRVVWTDEKGATCEWAPTGQP